MKKLLLLLLAFITLSVNAQEHLLFKGVPINGDIRTFLVNLVNNVEGISATEPTPGSTVEVGTCVYGDEEVPFIVSCSPITQTVFSVVVVVEAGENWHLLKDVYNTYKTSMIEAYKDQAVQAIDSAEEFFSPYEEGDTYEKHAFKEGKAVYGTVFTFAEGEIGVTISYVADSDSLVVGLSYVDYANNQVNEKEITASLSQDF